MISDAFPLDPPSDWFTTLPAWFEPNMKATLVTDGSDAGRFAGTVAQRGVFILGGGGDPWSAPDSPTHYRDAMQGDTICADGSTVRTANLSADLNHVPSTASFGQAVDAMANTGAQLARVRYVDVPGYGTVALGAAWPGLSDREVRKLQASALSGDWRWREEYGAYDMAGAIFVNNPGLPLPARPVFAPVAMAASVASPHPPILGSWQPTEAQAVTMTNPIIQPQWVQCALCGSVYPLGQQHSHVQTAAAGDIGVDAPAEEGDRLAELEAIVAGLSDRVSAIEEWITEDAMSEVDSMAAALPPAEMAAKYTTEQLQALADKDQVFNKDELNFPIADCEDVTNAVNALGRGNADEAAIKGYIIGAAKKINCLDSLPPDWVDASTQVDA